MFYSQTRHLLQENKEPGLNELSQLAWHSYKTNYPHCHLLGGFAYWNWIVRKESRELKSECVESAFSYFVMCQIVCGPQELWPRIARGPIGAIKHNKGLREKCPSVPRDFWLLVGQPISTFFDIFLTFFNCLKGLIYFQFYGGFFTIFHWQPYIFIKKTVNRNKILSLIWFNYDDTPFKDIGLKEGLKYPLYNPKKKYSRLPRSVAWHCRPLFCGTPKCTPLCMCAYHRSFCSSSCYKWQLEKRNFLAACQPDKPRLRGLETKSQLLVGRTKKQQLMAICW